MLTPQNVLQRVIEGHEIAYDDMVALMRMIMCGEVSQVLVAAILTGLRLKGETITEISASVTVLRELANPVEVTNRTHLIDVVGTGGDGAHTFNISTAVMFVAAAAGARVAKHGNRSVSSKSGSADILETLGAVITLNSEQVAQCLEICDLCFMFAPVHHQAMKHVASVRREMGVRTLFNILGPLTNPAGAVNTLMGVFHPDLVGIQVRVLRQIGVERALVVWGEDGMDELSLHAATHVAELNHGVIREYTIMSKDMGVVAVDCDLRVASPLESKKIVMQVLDNIPCSALEIVVLNAGAALYVANISDSISSGVELARTVIASGAARARLELFVQTSQRLANGG